MTRNMPNARRLASFKRAAAPANRQYGAVLIVGLVMLAVMTLLVVSMIKTSVVELKIGGANQIAQQNLTNAEVMINSFVDLNNGRFAANYLALPAASGGPVAPDAAPSSSYDAASTFFNVAPTDTHLGKSNLAVRQIQCSAQRITGTGLGAIQFVFFDVRSTATGTLGGSTTVHQGVRSVVPSGSC